MVTAKAEEIELRVSFVLPQYFAHPIGGYRIVYQHANALAARGHKVTIILPRYISGGKRLSIGTQLKALIWPAYIQARNRPLVSWQDIHPAVHLKLVGIMTEWNVPDGDAVIATAWQTAAAVANLPPGKGQKFYLVQDYENWSGVDLDELDGTFRLPLHVIAISKWLTALAAEKGARNVTHVTNAIDHNLFRVKNGTPTSRLPSVLALNHHDARKDTPLAVAALTRLHAKHPETPITMFGTPPRPKDLPSWIKYREKPVQEELVALYNAHSIYLSSSRKEGWALPPAEAMACGCAFVGTDSGGPRDYAIDGETALLSPPEEVEPLAANLIRAVEDEDLRRRLQTAGRARIREFTWAKSGDLMETVLRTEIEAIYNATYTKSR